MSLRILPKTVQTQKDLKIFPQFLQTPTSSCYLMHYPKAHSSDLAHTYIIVIIFFINSCVTSPTVYVQAQQSSVISPTFLAHMRCLTDGFSIGVHILHSLSSNFTAQETLETLHCKSCESMSQMGFCSSVGLQVNFLACPVKINASSWSLASDFSLPELGVSLLGGR